MPINHVSQFCRCLSIFLLTVSSFGTGSHGQGQRTLGSREGRVKFENFDTLLPVTTRVEPWGDFIVPYALSTSDYSENERRILLEAMKEISKRSCIRFKVRWSSEPKYLNFVKEDKTKCHLLYPRLETGEQKIGFNGHRSCLNYQAVLNLILISLGFSEGQAQRFVASDRSFLNCNLLVQTQSF